MHPTIQNVLAILAGVIFGMIVNMAIVVNGPSLIPLPEGIDPSDPNSLANGIHLLEAKHFISPFLAHAFGTLVAAFIAFKFAATYNKRIAIGMGCFFLIGGIASIFMIKGAPILFNVMDILFAYIPMAYLGALLAKKTEK